MLNLSLANVRWNLALSQKKSRSKSWTTVCDNSKPLWCNLSSKPLLPPQVRLSAAPKASTPNKSVPHRLQIRRSKLQWPRKNPPNQTRPSAKWTPAVSNLLQPWSKRSQNPRPRPRLPWSTREKSKLVWIKAPVQSLRPLASAHAPAPVISSLSSVAIPRHLRTSNSTPLNLKMMTRSAMKRTVMKNTSLSLMRMTMMTMLKMKSDVSTKGKLRPRLHQLKRNLNLHRLAKQYKRWRVLQRRTTQMRMTNRPRKLKLQIKSRKKIISSLSEAETKLIQKFKIRKISALMMTKTITPLMRLSMTLCKKKPARKVRRLSRSNRQLSTISNNNSAKLLTTSRMMITLMMSMHKIPIRTATTKWRSTRSRCSISPKLSLTALPSAFRCTIWLWGRLLAAKTSSTTCQNLMERRMLKWWQLMISWPVVTRSELHSLTRFKQTAWCEFLASLKFPTPSNSSILRRLCQTLAHLQITMITTKSSQMLLMSNSSMRRKRALEMTNKSQNNPNNPSRTKGRCRSRSWLIASPQSCKKSQCSSIKSPCKNWKIALRKKSLKCLQSWRNKISRLMRASLIAKTS